MSSTDANSLLTLSELNTYLSHCDVTVDCSKEDFFSVIGTMLSRENSYILKKRKKPK